MSQRILKRVISSGHDGCVYKVEYFTEKEIPYRKLELKINFNLISCEQIFSVQ